MKLKPVPTETGNVLHGDALELAPSLPQGRAKLVYLDPPFFSNRKRQNKRDGPEYDDRWAGGLTEYLAFLGNLLRACKPLLAPDGVMALHLDWRASHHGRIELERLFGVERFVNEIIWSYKTGGLSKRWLGRKHDTIHIFANGPDYTFNVTRAKSYLAHKYGYANVEIHEDDHGPYTLTALRDVWEIPALRGNQLEHTGYPTQKPQALLERLVECFTNVGDLVVDPCCGSGTTLVAAQLLNRRWLGIDGSEQAVALARQRLSNSKP